MEAKENMKADIVKLDNMALVALLFISIFQTFSLLLQGAILPSILFIISALLNIKALFRSPQKANHPYQTNTSLLAIFSIWLGFLFTFLFFTHNDQTLSQLGWLYILAACSFMLVSSRLAIGINILALVGLFFIIIRQNASLKNIEALLPICIFVLFISVINKYIKQLTHALNSARTTDILTGCANPSELKKEIKKVVELHHRYATHVSCLSLNFNLKFEQYPQYEIWLQELAQVCQSRLRNTDTICRYSDDKFILLLPNTGKKNALNLADDLLKACLAYDFSILNQEANTLHLSESNFTYKVIEYDGKSNWESWLQSLAN